MGARWRLKTGEESILRQGNPFWTKGTLSYPTTVMDMIDVWTNERNEDGACVVGGAVDGWGLGGRPVDRPYGKCVV